jgi:hypothetical protein
MNATSMDCVKKANAIVSTLTLAWTVPTCCVNTSVCMESAIRTTGSARARQDGLETTVHSQLVLMGMSPFAIF